MILFVPKMGSLKFCLIFLFLIEMPVTEEGVVGTFFWKPRLGLDLSVPTTEPTIGRPSKLNIRQGVEVILQGYRVALTVLVLAEGLHDANPSIYLDPTRAPFYTNAYRWAKRYLSLVPGWLGGNDSYCGTHQVWKKRYLYMEDFVPKWMRYLFPYVSTEDWENEIKQYERYKKHSEIAFTKHYRFPSRIFNNFRSEETEESADDVNSTISISA